MQSEDKTYILYVDDDLTNLKLFEESFKWEYHVLTESSTAKAFERLSQYPVKLVVADLRMPFENGLEFLDRISPYFPDIIKIILTAHVDPRAAVRAVNQGGIYRYILKPWDLGEVRQIIRNALTEYDLRVENKLLIKELSEKNEHLRLALEQSQESERKFSDIFDFSNDGICIFQGQTLLMANPSFWSIFRSAENENKDLLPNELFQKIIPDLSGEISRSLGANATSVKEMEISTSNSDRIHLELNNRRVLFKSRPAVLSIVRDITDRKLAERKILEVILHTQEEEQRRYAKELHDGLGPVLSTLKMYVEWLSDDRNVTNKEKITKQTLHCVDESIAMVREIARNLCPYLLEQFGLVYALRDFAQRINDKGLLTIKVYDQLKMRLPADMELALYRVLMEAISNCIKHAGANRIEIKFSVHSTSLKITFSDNGSGFDIDKTLKEQRGMGLLNMKQRISLIGGEFLIQSDKSGTKITINITNQLWKK